MTLNDLEWPFHASRVISAVAGLLVLQYCNMCDLSCNALTEYSKQFLARDAFVERIVALLSCSSVCPSVCLGRAALWSYGAL